MNMKKICKDLGINKNTLSMMKLKTPEGFNYISCLDKDLFVGDNK